MTGRSASTERHNNYLELKFKTVLLPYASGSTGKEGCYVLARVIDLDYQGEINWLTCSAMEERKSMSGIQETPWAFLVLQYLVIKVSENSQHSSPNRTTNGPYPCFTKEGLGHSASKEPGPAKVLTEGKGIENGFLEENSGKYQPRLCDELQK